MRAMVTCCTALTGCPFKSYESQKIQSSQRFIYHFHVCWSSTLVYTKTCDLTKTSDEHCNPHASTAQGWRSDDFITLDESSHPWVPAGYPRYIGARTRGGCRWPRFTHTHKHGSGAEYDHGNNHNTQVTRRATNLRTGGRRPKERHDRSRRRRPFGCDTTDFGLCGSWMDSAFALAEKVASVRRLIVNRQDLERQVAPRTSIIVILEATESECPEDPPELPQ